MAEEQCMVQMTEAKEAIRLDQFVAAAFLLSRAQAAKHIREGHVRCNESVTRKVATRLHPGDVIAFERQAASVTTSQPNPNPNPNPSIPILYEDDQCLVVNKCPGLAVHPAPSHRGEQTLIEIVREERSAPRLMLVHRLDKGTSGCLLIAKTAESCEAFQEQFEKRTVEKEYLAIVAGVPKEKEATIDAPLGRSLMDRKKMSLFRTSRSRNAVTSYKILSEANDAALLSCSIATGRTHQIRVHLAAIGHPILGDETYGNETSQKLSENLGIASPCLHAWKLTFLPPATRKEVYIEAPIPQLFREAAALLSLQVPEQ